MLRLIAGCLLVALAGCDSGLEVDLPDQDSRLVVTSLFAADSLISFEVGRSASAFQEPPLEDVTAATVLVYEDDVLAGRAVYEPNRLRFASTVRAVAGRTYRVEVSAPGFAPVRAQDTVPMPVPFEVASVERGPDPTDGRDREDTVTLRFQDPPGDDFYALYGLNERTFPGRPDQTQLFPLAFRSADPALADGDLTRLIGETEAPFYQRAVFRDTPFQGRTASVRLSVLRFEADDNSGAFRDTQRLRLARLSPTYYDYVRALEAARSSGTPFDDAVDVPSNVEGGFGIVAAFAATERVLEAGG